MVRLATETRCDGAVSGRVRVAALAAELPDEQSGSAEKRRLNRASWIPSSCLRSSAPSSARCFRLPLRLPSGHAEASTGPCATGWTIDRTCLGELRPDAGLLRRHPVAPSPRVRAPRVRARRPAPPFPCGAPPEFTGRRTAIGHCPTPAGRYLPGFPSSVSSPLRRRDSARLPVLAEPSNYRKNKVSITILTTIISIS